MTHEKRKNPPPKQPWQVDDDVALACIPEEGWVKDMVEYMTYCTDGPVWFQLGAILTALSTAAGKATLKVERSDGGRSRSGFQMWAVVIGISGTRKTFISKMAVNVLGNAKSALLMPSDGSVEGLHDALAEEQRKGVGLYYPDELSHILDASNRNYSRNFNSWLLQTYSSDVMNRALVQKKGETGEAKIGHEIVEPRLSILGSIPPRVLQAKTDKSFWSSGFLARFLFWGARRTQFSELEVEDPARADVLSKWLQRIIVDNEVDIVVPYEVAKPVLKWIRANVEDKDLGPNEDIESTLTRLQHKTFQIAGLLSIARRTTRCDSVMTVSEEDITYAMKVLKAMYGTFWALFAEVSGTTEGSQEKALIRYLEETPDRTRNEIGEALNYMTPTSLYRMLKQLVQEGTITETPLKREGRGRRTNVYALSVNDDDDAD